MTESVLDIMSGGTKAPGSFNKHSQIGETISGVIESVEIWEVRNFNTGQTETWDDGTPQKQLRILFQADPGTWAPQGEDDSGMRAHYVKAWNPHLKSLRDGLAASGEKEPKAGGWISIRYDHDQQNKSGYDTKIYVYQYQAPASDVSQMMGGGQPAPQAAPQQQYQTPPQQFQPQQAMANAQQPAAQQFQQQQTPVPPVTNVHTPQGQVNPNTGELMGQAAPVAPVPPAQPQVQAPQAAPQQFQQPVAQPPQQQAVQPPVQDPWDGQPAAQPQAPQQQAAGSGMDAAIIKLVQANLPDQTIIDTLAAQGVTAQQVAEVRASLGQ